ncbi:hypothetical protein D9O36_19260 [Zobellia amurskyensis]|uniref:BNR repeat protein n=1 Tax=Zobellia amurskyensis TaxID=248905 RepID=A0A7X2ZX31_9FLAO|nr:hypothetical protein [Zobellia amurskyensis]MUH37997.1 hypothetical protein [Zobellia amurskyensis]
MKSISSALIIGLAILFTSCKEVSKQEEVSKREIKKEIVNQLVSPVKNGSSLPSLVTTKNGALLSWVHEINDSLGELKYARLSKGEWAEPETIVQGSDWFINWADFPTISENNGNLLSHVLRKSSKETFSYDIQLNLKSATDAAWRTNLPLHTDGTKTEHGFVTILPYKEDRFFVTWLDGRNTGGGGHGHEGDMNIRAAEVAADGTVSSEVLLDAKTCSCCQTTAAITDNGPVVLYRDRTDAEIRDIAITRWVNGKWTEPKFIFNDGWEIKGCPVNGPKADAIKNDLAVAWFTAVNNEPKVQLVFSLDGGENFGTPILISDNNTMGRVDLILLDKENAIVSWMETLDKEAQIKAVKVNRSGEISKEIVVSELGASRKTGFPQMTLVGDKVHFAWTDVAKETSTIKMAYIFLNDF